MLHRCRNSRKFSSFFFIVVSFVAFAGSAQATDYYMSPQGNDSNDGRSVDKAWKTVSHVLSYNLQPGDTVYFRGGDYVINRFITFEKNGRDGAPITYKNYQGETPTIVYNAPLGNAGRVASAYISGDYNILDGINFRLPEDVRRRVIIDNVFFAQDGRKNPETVGGIALYGSNVVLRNCHIDNFSGHAIYLSSANPVVEYCRMTNNAGNTFYTASKNGTLRYNLLDGSRGYGGQVPVQMQYDRSQGNKIYGNLVINGQGSGIVMSGGISGNEVFNNVFINPGMKEHTPNSTDTNAGAKGPGEAISFWCEASKAPGPGNKIYNNTFIGRSPGGLIETAVGLSSGTYCKESNGGQPLAALVEIYNNIFYPSQPVPALTRPASFPNIHDNIFYNVSGSAPSGNTLINPMLKNPSGNTSDSAMLTASSPAIDKAVSPFPINDYQGGKRPFPFPGGKADIGAFEFGAPPGEENGPLGGGGGGGGGLIPGLPPGITGPNGEVCYTGF